MLGDLAVKQAALLPEPVGLELEAAAGGKSLSHTLARLASDERGYVRQAVAGNPATPPETLAGLAWDCIDGVRQELAKNRYCPFVAQEILSRDSNEYIRLLVAEQAHTLPCILERLAGDHDVWVRRAAERQLRSGSSHQFIGQLSDL